MTDRQATVFPSKVFPVDWHSVCNWYGQTCVRELLGFIWRQRDEISPSVISLATGLQENVLSSLALVTRRRWALTASVRWVCCSWLCARVQTVISTTTPFRTLGRILYLPAVAGNCSHAYPEPRKSFSVSDAVIISLLSLDKWIIKTNAIVLKTRPEPRNNHVVEHSALNCSK